MGIDLPHTGYSGANNRSVKQGNAAAIFRAIHALGPVARIDLARETGLTPGAVSNIVDQLLGAGLARESGARESRRVGRRAVNLEVEPGGRYALGIDIARSTVTSAIVDLTGRAIQRVSEPVASPRDEVAIPVALKIARDLFKGLPRDERKKVLGIGVGAVGPVDVRTRRHLAPEGQRTWLDLDQFAHLAADLDLPVYFENNANTSALAELWFGAAQGLDDFVLLTLGTGIGSGVVIDGELYRGEHGLAGEVGHMTVDARGPVCQCGNYGCLELYASVPGVLSRVKAELGAGANSGLGDVEVTIDAVIAALRDGDELAGRVFDELAGYLAAAILNLTYSVDPKQFLLGRELATAGDALLDRVRAEIGKRVFRGTPDVVDVQVADLPDAPVIGAATLALREFFRAPLPAA